MSLRENRRLSPQQLAATRNNAQKSTGPRTEAGKRRSALNALQHERYAKAPLRPILESIVALGGDLKGLYLPPSKHHQILHPCRVPQLAASRTGTLRTCRRAEAEGNEPENGRRIGKKWIVFLPPSSEEK